MKVRTKADARRRIRYRIRGRFSGTTERPRLAVFRSLKHIYAQVIDDQSGRTITAASSREEAAKRKGGNREAATQIGKLIAARCKENGIETVVFDRGGYKYHGRVRALADAAREAGLKF